MKFLATILTIFVMLSLVIASDIYEHNFSDAAHPGKCVISKDLILDPGYHPHPTDKCLSYDCNEDGTASVITSNPIGCEDEDLPDEAPNMPLVKKE